MPARPLNGQTNAAPADAVAGGVPADDRAAADEEDRLLADLAPDLAEDRLQCARLRHALQHMNARLRRVRAQLARAQRAADLDPLTGLPNRRALDMLAGRVRAGDTPGEGLVAVLFIDLDGFKAVNDRLGHAMGDALLRLVAERLSAATRSGDFICRVGGDEFVCVLLDIPDAAQAGRIAEKLAQRIAAPCCVGAERVVISASIGIAIHARPDADLAQMYDKADGAMYVAKSQGGGTVVC